jgi:hypothetical protein
MEQTFCTTTEHKEDTETPQQESNASVTKSIYADRKQIKNKIKAL